MLSIAGEMGGIFSSSSSFYVLAGDLLDDPLRFFFDLPVRGEGLD